MIRSTCGYEGGYTLHRRAGEVACIACLKAHAEYNRLSRHKLAEHGTPEAIKRHEITRTVVCDPCLDLACEQERERRAYYLAALIAFPRHEIAS